MKNSRLTILPPLPFRVRVELTAAKARDLWSCACRFDAEITATLIDRLGRWSWVEPVLPRPIPVTLA